MMKKRRRIFRSSAVLASSLAALLHQGPARGEEGSLAKKLRESVISGPSVSGSVPFERVAPVKTDRYPWRLSIVTTTFWIGERPTKNNPVPNHTSCWDARWAEHYGGTDDPVRGNRAEFIPVAFTPRQNPFYVALPYNDTTRGEHKAEAASVIPWFKDSFVRKGKSVLKDRWLAIRFQGKVVYAQWEDCGPFRTDHWQYVFGNERPKANLNKGAGLDVSPAVRDYLGMNDSDVTDWKFVDFEEVPEGPWSRHGDNNTFVINKQQQTERVADASQVISPGSAKSSVR